MATLRFEKINKVYPQGFHAVKDFNLEIADKEFVVFVGPSGCGKSTTLRMVAGLEDISSGKLYIDDVCVNDIEPKDRDIAMVFQNYALYPHMTVRENMSYALKIKKVPKDEMERKVQEAAHILGLEEVLDRKPKALSGGQRQRVALGRAIVRSPKVFLMDEPLSNLDAKLRVQMRMEIVRLHEQLGTTFIYVTHDQTEAMTMGDRIVIMEAGEIRQVGTPHDVYFYPDNLFVAGFIGSPQMNFFDVSWDGKIEGLNHPIALSADRAARLDAIHAEKRPITLGIRPEHFDLKAASPEAIGFEAEVEWIELLGSEKHLHCRMGDNSFLARVSSDYDIKRKEAVTLYASPSKLYFFDTESGENLLPEGQSVRKGGKE